MGIVNVTPDSFSDGGLFAAPEAAEAQARRLADEGADVLDIGGESSRPGAAEVPAEDEIARVVPVIAAIRKAGLTLPLSIDTRKATVAEAALDAGADWINDITGLHGDPQMAPLAAKRGCPVVVMHMRGTPADMMTRAQYADVVEDVIGELQTCVETALAAGIRRERLIVDPGVGFAKTPQQNLELLRKLPRLAALGWPVLVGASRKRFIGEALGASVDSRLEGTLAVTALAVAAGAAVVRVHDVEPNRRAADMAYAVRDAEALDVLKQQG